MATAPLFGGTNGVSVLDLGQPGGAKRTAEEVYYNPREQMVQPQVDNVLQKFPQQSITLIERMGYSGQLISWTGYIKFKDASELGDVISDLNLYLSGQSVNKTTGIRSTVDTDTLKATKLVNSVGTVLSAYAVMMGWQFRGERITLAASSTPYTLAYRALEVVFRITR